MKSNDPIELDQSALSLDELAAADRREGSGTLELLIGLARIAEEEDSVAGACAPEVGLAHWPAILDRYQPEALLGTGGHGAVLRALDLRLGRRIALKLAWPGVLLDRDASRRFVEEPRLVAALRHPGIVDVYDSGDMAMICYIALELIEGPTLGAWAKDHPQIPPRQAIELVSQVASALRGAHERDIVHRDLKPTNILMRPSNPAIGIGYEPVVSDFGSARGPRIANASRQTRTFAILGTDQYMSPEQASGQAAIVGPQSDIFSLGVILYELLVGQLPFEGETIEQTRKRIQEEQPRPIRSRGASISKEMETVVFKCLEKSPVDRYADAGELEDDLGRLLRGEPIRAQRASLARRGVKYAQRKPLVVSFLISGMVGVLILTAALTGWIVDRISATERLARAKAATVAAEEIKREHQYSSNIRHAGEALRRGNRREVLTQLEQCRSLPPEAVTPGIEWDWLWAQANAADHTLAAHATGVCTVRFSPMGDLLASAGKDGRIVLWESGTWKKKKELIYPGSEEISAAEFSADGSFLAVGGEDGRIVVYGMPGGRVVFDELIMKGRIFSLAWVGETTEIAAGGDGATLHIVDPLKNSRRHTVLSTSPAGRGSTPGHPTEIGAVTYVRNRNAIGVFMTPPTACFVDPLSMQTNAPSLTHEPLVGCVCSIQTTPEYLAATSSGLFIDIWKTDDGLKAASFPVPKGVMALRYSTATGELAAAFKGGEIRLYDLQSILQGRAVRSRKFGAHNGRTIALDFSPDGAWLASAGWDGELKLWRASTLREPLGLAVPGIPFNTAFSPCGRWLAFLLTYGDLSSRCTVVDARTGESQWSTGMLSWPDFKVGHHQGITFAPSGDEIALAESTMIRTYDVGTGHEKRTYPLPQDVRMTGLSYSPDGELLVLRRSYAEPLVVNRTTGDRPDNLVGPSARCLGIFRTIHGDLWLELEPSHRLALRASTSSEPMIKFSETTDTVDRAAVSPDGRYLSAAGHDGVLFIWDLKTSQFLGKCVGHENAVTELSFSRNGRSIHSLSQDGTVRIWHIPTCTEMLCFGTPQERFFSMAVNADNSLLVLGLQHEGQNIVQTYRLGEHRKTLPSAWGPIPDAR